MKRDARPGVDGMTWETYERTLIVDRGNCTRGSKAEHTGATVPSELHSEGRRQQRATAAVLSAIHEEDFLGFSYGFRPKRSQHDALTRSSSGISSKR